MDRLILKIDGDPNGGIGPARGGSKLKKLQDLELFARYFIDLTPNVALLGAATLECVEERRPRVIF
jgi:hypothetical protein